jgi:hypothetical protein
MRLRVRWLRTHGAIRGNDNDADAVGATNRTTTRSPAPDQVQIYEAIMGDRAAP